MNQHLAAMARQGLVPALGRGEVQELARYKLPNFILLCNFRRERQLEGIAKAKAAGVYKGRTASINAAVVREMRTGRKSAEPRSPHGTTASASPCCLAPGCSVKRD
jgi:hypothetical protein